MPGDILKAELKKDRSTLAARIVQVKNAVPANATSIWAGLADPLAAPDAGVVADRFKECMELTIEEGSSLYSELSDSGFGPLLERLDKMPDGSHLRIVTDSAFLPWEILFPEGYSRIAAAATDAPPPDPKRMWGYRFITEYNMLETNETGIQWDPLLTAHASRPPFVSLNLDSTIEQSAAGRPFCPIEFHREFYDDNLAVAQTGAVYDSAANILGQLYSKDQQATFLYFYCHGRNTVPFDVGGEELLKFDANSYVRPRDLIAVENVYNRAPIVFLNSCTSGQPSPLSFASFHSAFRKMKAMGIIGTAIKIPITFGAAFGCALLSAHYIDGKPPRTAIWALRRKLVERGNPLGLFYSLRGQGNRVTLAAGNHDVDLYWADVQKKIRDTAGDINFETGKDVCERYDGRLQIGHGHMMVQGAGPEMWKKVFDVPGAPTLSATGQSKGDTLTIIKAGMAQDKEDLRLRPYRADRLRLTQGRQGMLRAGAGRTLQPLTVGCCLEGACPVAH
jgi:hypothetical protein